MHHLLSLVPLLLGLALAPFAARAQDYVGSERCIECHREAGDTWRGSHHALAWTLPEPGNIRADFDGTSFALGDMEARFRLAEDGPHVEVTERDGVTTDHKVHSVIGVEPLQQYVIETEPGRLQSFDVVWDTERGDWFHLYPDSNPPPDDALHWTGPYKNWNGRCAACHATGFKANYDPVTRSYASTQAEIGVGCEACHGPGSKHIGWAEDGAENGTAPAPAAYGLTVDMGDTGRMIEQCATCHSRREPYTDGNPVPGTPYHDTYNLSLLTEGAYEADGQILGEVYVYGSFLQSRMYAKGVGCTDCHRPHEADLIADGNAVCTQCHSPAGNPEFPSLPLKVFDGPGHTHHPEGSDGASCKSCHMVERVYMGNDWRADHSFRIPRPDLAAVTGAPDACTTCHEGESQEWAAAKIEEWFPDSDKRGPHYGEALAHGRRDPAGAAAALRGLAQGEDMPGLVRATALYLLQSGADPEDAAALEGLIADPDPLVRAAAVGLQRAAPPTERAGRLLAPLGDSSRSVRMAAAREMLNTPIAHMPKRYAEMMRRAVGEWQSALASRLDFPETHLQMGGTALMMRNIGAAENAFAEASRLDPQLVDAWIMQVRLAVVTGDEARAKDLLSRAIALNPDNLPLQMMRSELTGEGFDLAPPPRSDPQP